MDKEFILLHLSKEGIGWSTFKKIETQLKDISLLIKEPYCVRNLKNIREVTKRRLLSINWSSNIEKILAQKEINFVTIYSSEYPEKLKRLLYPPYVLFYKGDKTLLQKKGIAIVGSRKASSKGKEMTKEIAQQKAKKGYVIISGMALGIDTWAHKGALEEGTTIAVLGSSLDYIYPPENRRLFHEITKKGLAISTYFPTTKPRKYNFPERNSIIAALSEAVIVVEAGEKSGALITAQWAQNIGVPVYVCPINSPGNKKLLGSNSVQVYPIPPPVQEQEHDPILELLMQKGHLSIDEIGQLLNIDIPTLQAKLMELELEGEIRRIAGGFYEKR
ncbi:DNA processing protein [Thermosulfidibacter takaii ABI70S6]|uniref:DNA processing protein n=1 Tax=Thermosulfidibacter takaii (strain DSM 17441 / JCM 13301 / NBRC 103674 / ABI70S6) TaxID=1298851 RepID=A0A0S3QTZ6_THET7|nr:DNA-processing protein DprA [Thermosulfidibacter takaii]BAT71805.1 DNA processing protein [Thermosulfidibacter takaii ABI70S6]